MHYIDTRWRCAPFSNLLPLKPIDPETPNLLAYYTDLPVGSNQAGLDLRSILSATALLKTLCRRSTNTDTVESVLLL